MQNKVKAFVAAALLAVVSFVPVAAHAAAKAPKHSGGIVFPDPSFIGLNVARINASATPVVVATGPGLLYAICPTGGTIGQYAVAYDYLAGAANPIAPYINPAASAIGQYLVSPQVHYTAGTPDVGHACWVPPYPVRYENSLVGYTNSSTNNVLFLYRLDSGLNP